MESRAIHEFGPVNLGRCCSRISAKFAQEEVHLLPASCTVAVRKAHLTAFSTTATAVHTRQLLRRHRLDHPGSRAGLVYSNKRQPKHKDKERSQHNRETHYTETHTVHLRFSLTFFHNHIQQQHLRRYRTVHQHHACSTSDAHRL